MPSASSLFVSVFDQSDEDEDSEVSVFTSRMVMLLMVLISSEELIYFTSVASLKMSVNHATHLPFVFQFTGSVSLIHSRIVELISGSASAKRISSSWPECLDF